MSRAAVSKSRADKGKPPASQTPVVSHEIVPGKFNDNDWNLMVDRDGAEDFVEDIVDDLITITLDKCFDLYLSKQLLPFTVSQAKDAILSIIEWRFLARDEGEKEPEKDPGWLQDEEPDPAETDCWAQGSVPKSFVPSPVPEPVKEEPELEQEKETQAVVEPEEKEQFIEEDPELEDKVSVDEEAEKEEAEKLAKGEEEKAKAEAEQKKKKRFKPYTGRLRSPGLKNTESLEQTEMSLLTKEIEAIMPPPPEKRSGLITMPASCHSILKQKGLRKTLNTESLEQTEMSLLTKEIEASMPPPPEKRSGLITMPDSCHSILKVQAGRPPGNKDVEYDDYGNVVAVVRLNPERLPSHRIKVNYQVVDPAVEAAQARLDAMRTGRYVAPKLKKRTIKKDDSMESKESETDLNGSKIPAKTPLPPPMLENMDVAPGVTIREGGRVKQGPARLENMDVAPGVTIREGGRVKQGPARYIRRIDTLSQTQKGLKPVSTQLGTPRLDVSELLDRHTPILRPIHDNTPLPPIMAIPHPPEKPKIST